MGKSRNIRNKIPIRIPIAPSTKVMKSKKEYERDKHKEMRIIIEGLKEWEREQKKGEHDIN